LTSSKFVNHPLGSSSVQGRLILTFFAKRLNCESEIYPSLYEAEEQWVMVTSRKASCHGPKRWSRNGSTSRANQKIFTQTTWTEVKVVEIGGTMSLKERKHALSVKAKLVSLQSLINHALSSFFHSLFLIKKNGVQRLGAKGTAEEPDETNSMSIHRLIILGIFLFLLILVSFFFFI
jgi:hypothetical protein